MFLWARSSKAPRCGGLRVHRLKPVRRMTVTNRMQKTTFVSFVFVKAQKWPYSGLVAMISMRVGSPSCCGNRITSGKEKNASRMKL